MPPLRFWQQKLDNTLHPRYPNSWAARRAILRWALFMAFWGNPRPSLVIWIVMVLFCPGIGIWGALAATVGYLTYKAIKRRTARLRPFEKHTHITAYAPPPDPHSFPSGHTLNAVVLAMSLAFLMPLLAPLVVLWILMMGLARVVLGLHYPSDVVAGILLGTLIGAFGVAAATYWPIPSLFQMLLGSLV
jgi:undecaprenyl-diphosphatase